MFEKFLLITKIFYFKYSQFFFYIVTNYFIYAKNIFQIKNINKIIDKK